MRLDDKLEDLRNSLPKKTKRAIDLAAEKCASSWLTVIPVKEMDLNLNKREFKDAVHLRYDWQRSDLPNVCVCGESFNVDHAMICKRARTPLWSLKNLLVLIYSKLHSKSCDYLN